MHPLEQVDFIEFEKKEQFRHYVEQSTQIMATARSQEMAKKLLDLLRAEFFIGYKDTERRLDQTRVEELTALQNYTYQMNARGSHGILEIRKNNS